MASIVVIDSEAVVRSVVSSILCKAGYEVRAFGDLDKALEGMRTSKPDLVLTNVFMTGITGHDAMLKMKREFPGLSVLMMSGVPDDEAIRVWEDAPNFDIFPKPFLAGQLIAKVREIMQSKPRQDGAHGGG